MSMFGYRRELSKYEDLDDDELLASLTAEELQELEKELSDIDPDGNVPIGLRQRDQTAKTPTGTFSREALMKYWENETRKLLEEEIIGSGSPRQKDEDSREDGECMTDTEESEEEKEEAEENEKDNEEAKKRDDEEEEESELEEPVTEEEEDEEEDEEDEEENSEPPVSSPPQHQPYLSSNGQSNLRPVKPAKRYSPPMCEPRVQVQESSRMSGNPTVVDDVLEKILNNDSDTIEVNLNNIENISQETLIRFSEALRFNMHVRLFSLANTHADDQVAFAIAKMLRENCHITNLNLESNFITGKGILALVQALTRNRTLTELRFHNQRHICGGQVEMEIVKLLRENTTVIKLGYQFDLPGPRISMTTILTRNQDLKRQKRIQEQQQGGAATAANPRTAELQKTGIVVSPYGSPRSSPWSSPKLPHVDMSKKNAPPPPPPPPPPPLPPGPQSEASSEKKAPTRTIAELIKRQEASSKKQNPNPPKSKTKKAKKGPGRKTKTDSILKELKNALKPIGDRENSRPSTPQRCAHDQLMAAIKGSSIRNLRKVEVPKYLQ